MVSNQRGDVLMTWSRSPSSEPGHEQSFLRRTSPVLPTLKLRLKGGEDIAVDRDGNFVTVWTGPSPAGRRVFGQRYNSNGTTRGPVFNVATSTTGDHTSPSVAMNQNTGEFVVVWEVRNKNGAGVGVYGQRFGFTTGSQGSEFLIFVAACRRAPNSLRPFAAQVARADDGSFVVIWRNPGAGGFLIDVLGQRYDNAGAPVGARC